MEMDQYRFTERMTELYNCLQDDLSRKIFWARLRCDVERDMDAALRLGDLFRGRGIGANWKERFDEISSRGGKIILYGAGGGGMQYAELIRRSSRDFWAFCDKNRRGQLLGKPILTPDELIEGSDRYYVVIDAASAYKEIITFLQKNGFPAAHILHDFDAYFETQYFEFPELFRKGTAFVDAGCFDGADSVRFAEWCDGEYSRILAFEPDSDNYKRCQERFCSLMSSGSLHDVKVLQAGLSNGTGTVGFAVTDLNKQGGYLTAVDADHVSIPRLSVSQDTIQAYALDDLVDVEIGAIGMIKMDIEGAESDALHGAEKTIRRDKPLLAVSVYHRQGDMLAIMDYLKSIVPEYRFWLRHYGLLQYDTVLYAAI